MVGAVEAAVEATTGFFSSSAGESQFIDLEELIARKHLEEAEAPSGEMVLEFEVLDGELV